MLFHLNKRAEASLPVSQRSSQSPDRMADPVFRILDSKQDVWPEDLSLPTVIVSCIPTKDVNGESSVNTSLPDNWLSSPTGGVVIEVSTITASPNYARRHLLIILAFVHATGDSIDTADKTVG